MGCTWCVRSKGGGLLQTPYCVEQQHCYFGQEGFPDPYEGNQAISIQEGFPDPEGNHVLTFRKVFGFKIILDIF